MTKSNKAQMATSRAERAEKTEQCRAEQSRKSKAKRAEQTERSSAEQTEPMIQSIDLLYCIALSFVVSVVAMVAL